MSYTVTFSRVRSGRGMPCHGLWLDGTDRAIGAYDTQAEAVAVICGLEGVSEGGNEIQGQGWIFMPLNQKSVPGSQSETRGKPAHTFQTFVPC